MLRTLHASGEHWPLATPFRISRGVRTQADLVVAEVRQGDLVGRGEGAPIPRYGDSVESCVAQLEAIAGDVSAGLDRLGLVERLPPGAARNALDCALWDLEAKVAGRDVASLIGRTPTGHVTTALTVGLDTPDAMAAAAAKLADYPLVKVKVNADDPAAQLRAVRAACPKPVLVVDANEAWDLALLKAMQPVLADLRISLLEQPLPAADDALLAQVTPAVPICADESCHLAQDVARLKGLYQAVNIKLDKTGGLTAALDLLTAARAAGMTVMTGCMISTSLSIAAAFHVAEQSDFVDVDGPTWLSQDRDGGVTFDGQRLLAPSPALWGGA